MKANGRTLLIISIAWLVMFALVVSLPLIAKGEDTKEVLTLKRDLTAEKILRIQTQLQLMQQSFAEGQEALKQLKVELDGLNAKLKAMEPKPVPKPEGK